MSTITFSELSHFTPKQWEVTAIADAHKYTLYGGKRGPGKSYWLRWYPARFLMKVAAEHNVKGARWGLFCEDYPSLKDRQITKIEKEFPDWLGTLKDSKTEGLAFHMHEAYGGGIIALRNLDDPTKYKSSEFIGASVDELTQNKSMDTFNTLRASLRWPGFADTKFIAGTNPDGPGQKWVRQLWIERNFPPEMMPIADKFAYVTAGPYDNPNLSPEYWEELATLTASLRKAWLEGDWYVTFEGLVYEDFNQDNITTDEPDPDKGIELAFDDGYIDARCFLLIQRHPTHILIFDEIYHRKHIEEECVSELIDLLAARYGWKNEEQRTPNRLPDIAVGSPEAKTLHRHLRNAGIPVRTQQIPSVAEALMPVRALIKDGKGYRSLRVHPRCKNLLEEMTSLYVYPEGARRTSTEKPLDKNNHACDALRDWTWVRARK